MNTTRSFEWLALHLRTLRVIMVPVLLLMIAGVALLVTATGGIKFVYSHSMYVPILLTGFLFGMRGGLAVGFLGGLALGPLIPIDVVTGEMQATINWIYRTGFFMLIGMLSGIASDSVRSYLKHLKWIAGHDAATQLPNRHALVSELASLDRRKDPGDSFALVVISLENTMELRSAFGFNIIEEIVQQTASRYANILGHKTQVCRIDTAHLGMLVQHSSTQPIEHLVERLMEGARQPFQFNAIPIHADARFGYVVFDNASQPPDFYLQRAEAALIAAHESGQDCLPYSIEINTVAKENLSMLGSLMSAIHEGQLSLHYQPKVDLRTGKLHGVEALMRWRHPERGNISPAVFIPRAEQSTLINLLTEFALEQAMKQVAQWRLRGMDIQVAVNISPRNLLQPGFSDQILRLLQRHGVSGRSLELELTERALMTNLTHTVKELARLAAADVAISIDDFGTGHSSLQYLHQLPISLIKIDQSFVQRLPADQGALHIVEAAVTLAHNLGMQTIAEGVETVEACQLLSELGCDMVQGYLISRPLPAAAFEEWYKQYADNALPAHSYQTA